MPRPEISPPLGPDESNEPIAIDARERGEYSAESLRDDECGDGGLSCFVDACDSLEAGRRGEDELRDVRWRFRDGCVDTEGGGAFLVGAGGEGSVWELLTPCDGFFS